MFKSVAVFSVIGLVLIRSAYGIFEVCSTDADCSSLVGAVCTSGNCVCPAGQQSVQGGTRCADLSPYHTSPCLEDHQCSRLSVAYECRRNNGTDQEGNCHCQTGYHFHQGRCWQSVEYGQPCSRDQECISASMRDPNAMVCSGTCQCASAYYLRQRGECRRIGYAVGDGCVLDEDCQFEGGACDRATFSCYNGNTSVQGQSIRNSTASTKTVNSTMRAVSRQHAAECSSTSPCPDPFQCSAGVCLCPLGYYHQDGSCMAELGSPSSPEQCVGFLAVVVDGICTCPANFFFEENMRDCVRVTRMITESCVTDENCRTFGAEARCGEGQPPWGLRSCECTPGESLWDGDREMCRLFVGIGETCEFDSDCIAGEMQIQCLVDDQGQGYCACPTGYSEVEGLCLTTGLDLGDVCQASPECTATPNTVCESGVCACDPAGYTEVSGYCASVIGGTCSVDEDCVIENSQCSGSNGTLTCQCRDEYVEYDNNCWPALLDVESSCNLTAQCQIFMGAESACVDGLCTCSTGFHFRDSACWPVTGLFETCSRTSQCYLPEISERVVCRNSMCQCDFHYPYSEELQTCASSASSIVASFLTIAFAIFSATKIL